LSWKRKLPKTEREIVPGRKRSKEEDVSRGKNSSGLTLKGRGGERERCYSFGGEAIESFQRGSDGEEEEYFQRGRSLHGIDSQSVRERGEGVTVLLEGKGSGN